MNTKIVQHNDYDRTLSYIHKFIENVQNVFSTKDLPVEILNDATAQLHV
jgi:hypothetical protein